MSKTPVLPVTCLSSFNNRLGVISITYMCASDPRL
jgi:hypothetical protein